MQVLSHVGISPSTCSVAGLCLHVGVHGLGVISRSMRARAASGAASRAAEGGRSLLTKHGLQHSPGAWMCHRISCAGMDPQGSSAQPQVPSVSCLERSHFAVAPHRTVTLWGVTTWLYTLMWFLIVKLYINQNRGPAGARGAPKAHPPPLSLPTATPSSVVVPGLAEPRTGGSGVTALALPLPTGPEPHPKVAAVAEFQVKLCTAEFLTIFPRSKSPWLSRLSDGPCADPARAGICTQCQNQGSLGGFEADCEHFTRFEHRAALLETAHSVSKLQHWVLPGTLSWAPQPSLGFPNVPRGATERGHGLPGDSPTCSAMFLQLEEKALSPW